MISLSVYEISEIPNPRKIGENESGNKNDNLHMINLNYKMNLTSLC